MLQRENKRRRMHDVRWVPFQEGSCVTGTSLTLGSASCTCRMIVDMTECAVRSATSFPPAFELQQATSYLRPRKILSKRESPVSSSFDIPLLLARLNASRLPATRPLILIPNHRAHDFTQLYHLHPPRDFIEQQPRHLPLPTGIASKPSSTKITSPQSSPARQTHMVPSGNLNLRR